MDIWSSDNEGEPIGYFISNVLSKQRKRKEYAKRYKIKYRSNQLSTSEFNFEDMQ